MNEFTVVHAEAPQKKQLGRFLKEFRRRRVGRATSTYALAMWLSLQVVDIGVPMLDLPEWTMSLMVILGLLGFPLVIVLAWIFQITADGIIIDAPPGDCDKPLKQPPLALDATLLALIFSFTVFTSVLLANG